MDSRFRRLRERTFADARGHVSSGVGRAGRAAVELRSEPPLVQAQARKSGRARGSGPLGAGLGMAWSRGPVTASGVDRSQVRRAAHCRRARRSSSTAAGRRRVATASGLASAATDWRARRPPRWPDRSSPRTPDRRRPRSRPIVSNHAPKASASLTSASFGLRLTERAGRCDSPPATSQRGNQGVSEAEQVPQDRRHAHQVTVCRRRARRASVGGRLIQTHVTGSSRAGPSAVRD